MSYSKILLKKICWFSILIGISICSYGCSNTKDDVISSSEASNNNLEKSKNWTLEIGESVETTNYRITVNGTRRLLSDSTGFFKAEDGFEFLLIDCTLENISKTDQVVSTILMFSAYDDKGELCNQSLFSETKGQLDGKIEIGGKISGEYTIQVPIDSEGYVLEITDLSGEKVKYYL